MAVAKLNEIRHHHCLGSVSIQWPLQKGLMLKPRIHRSERQLHGTFLTTVSLPIYQLQLSQPALEQGSGLQHTQWSATPWPTLPEKAFQCSHTWAFSHGRDSGLEGCCVILSSHQQTHSHFLQTLTKDTDDSYLNNCYQWFCSYVQSNTIKIAFSAILSRVPKRAEADRSLSIWRQPDRVSSRPAVAT